MIIIDCPKTVGGRAQRLQTRPGQIHAVSGAIFLILELDQPFGGLIQISSQPILNVLSHIAK